MNQTILTEQDIKKLFKEGRPRPSIFGFFKSKIFREIVEWLILIIVVFFVGYLVINWPTFSLKFQYLYTAKIKKQSFSTQEISSPAFLPSEEKGEQKLLESVAYLPDNRLYIDKIKVDAPIVWEIPENQILEELKNGVVHFQGTSLPGQEKGNIFITGHSSGYWWSKDLYNQVFALLDRLEPGDKIALTFQGKKHTYEVYDKMVVKPTQVEVLKSQGEEPILSLMTCVPVGTNLRRLIVQAKEILVQEIKPPEKPAEEKAEEAKKGEKPEEQPKEVKPEPQKEEKIPDIEIPIPPLYFLPDVP